MGEQMMEPAKVELDRTSQATRKAWSHRMQMKTDPKLSLTHARRSVPTQTPRARTTLIAWRLLPKAMRRQRLLWGASEVRRADPEERRHRRIPFNRLALARRQRLLWGASEVRRADPEERRHRRIPFNRLALA